MNSEGNQLRRKFSGGRIGMNPPLATEMVPDAVAMDIFLKLPVKSLVRFRCVSKSLSAAFRTPEFIAAHHYHQKRNRNLSILLKLGHGRLFGQPYFAGLSAEFLPTENIWMPFLEDCHLDPYVTCPCNGLLCLGENDRIALWNPSTREFKLLPPSSIRRPPSTVATHFGPVGLGLDCRSGEYKVIRFVRNYTRGFANEVNQVELYTLTSNSWREIAVPDVVANDRAQFGDMEYGIYHWSGIGRDGELILSFDMRNELFGTTALPEFGEDYLWDFLERSDGALAAIAYPRIGREKCFDLWVKKEEWIKKLSIGPIPGLGRPLGFWKNEKLYLESCSGELELLDVQTGERKNCGVSASLRKMKVIVYAESLVPIHGRTEHQENIVRERACFFKLKLRRRPRFVRRASNCMI